MKHKVLFEILRREILAGKYNKDMRLPSEATLARRFGISRPTISRVTLDLKREGLIVTHQGAASTITRFALNATGALGLVVPGESYAEIFKPILASLDGIAERAGWDLIHGEIKSSDPKVRAREVRRLAYRFSTEHVTGVFFQPLEFLKNAYRASEEAVRYFEEAGIAVLLLDYDIMPMHERSRYDIVGIDNVAAGYAIGRHLLESGARRLAFLHRPDAASTVTNRMRGVASAVLEKGGNWSLNGNVLFAEPENRRAVARFIAKNRPDTFVAGNDLAAIRLQETLRKIGGAAAHLRLAGFDDVAAAEKAGLTTMRQPLDDIAAVAFQTLISRINSPGLPPRTILLPATLVAR